MVRRVKAEPLLRRTTNLVGLLESVEYPRSIGTDMRNGARRNHWLGRLTAHGAALEVTLLVALSTYSGCDYSRSIGDSDGDAGIPTTRTGILIVNDGHNRWSLASGNELFQLHGNRSELTKYERQRVTINGGIYGPERLNVLSIKPGELIKCWRMANEWAQGFVPLPLMVGGDGSATIRERCCLFSCSCL